MSGKPVLTLFQAISCFRSSGRLAVHLQLIPPQMLGNPTGQALFVDRHSPLVIDQRARFQHHLV